jgi:hypothetical protein
MKKIMLAARSRSPLYFGVVPISSRFAFFFRESNAIHIVDKFENVISASRNNINGVLTKAAPLFRPIETVPPSIISIFSLLLDFINSSIF